MPDTVRVAGGVDGGVYGLISTELARRVKAAHPVDVTFEESGGSLDNRQHLLKDRVDVAPMQVTAVKGDRLFLVAPLFHELLYVLARSDSEIKTIDDLPGHRVAVGPLGSGSRETTESVFDSLQLGDGIRREVIDWQDLLSDNAPDAAMLWFGRGSTLVNQLISEGRWRLIPIENGRRVSNQHPALHVMVIEASEFPGGEVTENVPTVGTTAFLVARDDTPSELVIAFLEALYQEPPPCLGLLPRSLAGEWGEKSFHPAARSFFGLGLSEE